MQNDVPFPLRRTLLVLLLALGGTLAGAFVAHQWLGRGAQPAATRTAAVYSTPRPLPDFALVAHDGSPFDRARLKGHWTLLFFGFTHCPDVCPATLAQLGAVRRRLEDLPPAQRPEVVMVSVDPRRDTPERLAEYVPYFGRDFLGVTGEASTLEQLTRAMGVAVFVGPEVDGTYTVDHTAALFLIDPSARLAAIFPTPHEVDVIAADYRSVVARSGG